MHSELSYGLSIAPKLQRVGISIHFPSWDQPTPDPSFSLLKLLVHSSAYYLYFSNNLP